MMVFKVNLKSFGIGIILSLAAITIVSVLLSNYTNLEVIETGKAYIILFITIFLTYFFVAMSDGKIDRHEIFTVILILLTLVSVAWALKYYIPEIFSVLPEPTKDLLNAAL